MDEQASARKQASRRQLATLLGIHDEMLVDRNVAARLLGLTSTSLRRRPAEGPPYYREGKWTWYLREQVEGHAAFRRRERGQAGLLWGAQSKPEAIARPRVTELHGHVDKWRDREEWRRSHSLVTLGARPDSQWRRDAVPRLVGERAMLAAYAEGTISKGFKALAETVIGQTIPDDDWTAGLFLLVDHALRIVVEKEERWLSGDVTDMPKVKPSSGA